MVREKGSWGASSTSTMIAALHHLNKNYLRKCSQSSIINSHGHVPGQTSLSALERPTVYFSTIQEGAVPHSVSAGPSGIQTSLHVLGLDGSVQWRTFIQF